MHILLVEDNLGDAELAVEAFSDGKISNSIDIVEDGVEAMEYLNQQGEYSKTKKPDLILLDLNLPKMDGREVLTAIKGDEKLKTIPVVILSTSDNENDIKATYRMGSNCYIVKPIDFDEFCRSARLIEEFWFSLVKLPPN